MHGSMTMPVITPANRLITGITFLLASMMVLADQLELPPSFSDSISEEIYQDGESWRVPPANESQWRSAPEVEDTGRIKFGYDPVYERIQSNRKPLEWDTRADDPLRSEKAADQLRLDFF